MLMLVITALSISVYYPIMYSGVVTTAGVFTGLSGTIHNVEVEAFDNYGIPPTNRRTGIVTVSFLANSYNNIIMCRVLWSVCKWVDFNYIGMLFPMIVQVRIYKLTDQVIITFKIEKDLVERKLGRIQRYSSNSKFLSMMIYNNIIVIP